MLLCLYKLVSITDQPMKKRKKQQKACFLDNKLYSNLGFLAQHTFMEEQEWEVWGEDDELDDESKTSQEIEKVFKKTK